MAIDIVARALAVSGKQNLENYYTKNESDARYVKKATTTNQITVYMRYNTADLNVEAINNPTEASNGNIPIYSNGNLRTVTPKIDTDAANKQYVDNKTAVLIDNSLLGV